jgi:hypothetical protein
MLAFLTRVIDKQLTELASVAGEKHERSNDLRRTVLATRSFAGTSRSGYGSEEPSQIHLAASPGRSVSGVSVYFPVDLQGKIRLSFASAKALLQFKQRVRDKVFGHRLAVIEPEREQDLEAPK